MSDFSHDQQLPVLTVNALGRMDVLVDGHKITKWDGELPRDLLFFVIDHPVTTRNEIFDAFWRGMTVKEATNVFHVTKRKVSEKLAFGLTRYVGPHYFPSGSCLINYDVQVFEEGCDALSYLDSDSRLEDWLDVARLYTGDYLPRITRPWVVMRRAALKDKATNLFAAIGLKAVKLNDKNNAEFFLLKAAAQNPIREDVVFEYMRLQYGLGRPQAAKTAYNTLEQALKQAGIPMQERIIKLYNRNRPRHNRR